MTPLNACRSSDLPPDDSVQSPLVSAQTQTRHSSLCSPLYSRGLIDNLILYADNPWFVGFNLICGLDNAFILGYSFLIMSFLGWAAGSVLFIVGMVICFYCNCVTGTLHTLGGHRNIHFRDLARTGFG